MSEESETIRFQIIDKEDGTSDLELIWPGDEPVSDDQFELEKAAHGEIRDLIRRMVEAVWARAKLNIEE